MNPQDTSAFLPFHEDEVRAQALAGQRAGRAAIRPFMPDQHREFFSLLPYLFTATSDRHGWPVASVLTGEPGFVQSPDPATLAIAARPAAGDPASSGFQAGAGIGLVGIDFTTRRRNRANGVIAAVGDGLTVRIAESFGNCPQYIQTRTPSPRAAVPAPVERLGGLDAASRTLISSADTFFVATRSRAGVAGGGLDMSHRGGMPGFVRVEGDRLVVPDFRGNRFFNTLGNLLGDPRAGLLFMDFDAGDLLQLQGTVSIDWQTDNGPQGTQRVWQYHVERAWRRRRAFPFAWEFGAYAPTTLATGAW
ncbi:MAG: pyridoxamine 5'-phosphate oxidase family protein [Pseudomonadota bacterium]